VIIDLRPHGEQPGIHLFWQPPPSAPVQS